MPAVRSASARNKILSIGTQVYFSYLFLDMLSSNYYVSKSDDFNLNGEKTSLKEFISTLLLEGKTEENFSLGSRHCHIKLTAGMDNEWEVNINNLDERLPTSLEPIQQYRADDFLNFCQKYPLKVSQNNLGDLKFSIDVNINEKHLTLGGKEKLDLYQLHLSNLYTILTRFEDDNANLNMLVSMATGSGKSFTQALWFLVQHLADNSCFFAVSNESLVAQLKRDFERLLPTAITQHLFTHRPNEAIPLNQIPQWGIMSHTNLLQTQWSFLQAKETQNSELFLCIDEEHLATEEELYNDRIQLLIENFPAMLLSATPSEAAYQICNGQPVASLSRQEKEELGIAKAATFIEAKTQGVITKNRNISSLTMKEKHTLNFVDSIEEERLSPAHEYVDQSETAIIQRKKSDPFYEHPSNHEKIRRFMRWNIQSSVGEKALILTDRHDPVINLNLLSKGSKRNPYRNGNRVDRRNVYQFFNLGEVLDDNYFVHYERAKIDWRSQQFDKALEENYPDISENDRHDIIDEHIDFSDTPRYMEYRVLHGLIDNTLSYLLKIDNNQLDYERFQRFDTLCASVREQLGTLPRLGAHLHDEEITNTIQDLLRKDNLPINIAHEIANTMVQLLNLMDQQNEGNLKLIIDNWQLDKKLHALFPKHSYKPEQHAIASFLEKYKTIFLVNGLEKSPSGIESNRPFFNLSESFLDQDSDEVKANERLRHKLSTLEALDNTVDQAVYNPNYCPVEYTPDVIDTLFRKGLIGTYITSEKVIGFNDVNLNHLCMLVDDPEDPMNSPEHIVQGSGRNRGLNPAREPFFYLINDAQTPVGLPTNVLEKKDYFPDFFTAQKEHHKKLTQGLGAKIADQIKHYIESQIQPDGKLHTNDFKLKLNDIILTEFEKVYKKNHFDFNKSRKVFSTALAEVYQSIYAHSEQIKNTHTLSGSARVVAAILNFLCTLYYKLSIAWSYLSFVVASKKIGDLKNENTYTHIVRNFNYKELITTTIPMKKWSEYLKDDIEKTFKFALEEHPDEYIHSELAQELNELFKQDISNKFIRYIGTNEQQLFLLELIRRKDNWLKQGLSYLKDENLTIDDYFSIINTDPEIAAFLQNNHLEVENDRSFHLQARLAELQTQLKDIFLANFFQDPADLQREVSIIFSRSLDELKFLFTPKDMAFLSRYKNEINIDLNALANFHTNLVEPTEIPIRILELLRMSFPPEVMDTANREGCLSFEDYKTEDKVHKLKEKVLYVDDLFNMNNVRDLLAHNVERYLKNSLFIDLVNNLVNRLSEEHLETMFDAIYPEDSSEVNKEKIRKLVDFKTDIKLLSSIEIFNKYANFNDPTDFENTDIAMILSHIHALYEEILACESYWHDIGSKGEPIRSEKEPNLLRHSANEDHPIWQYHATENQSDSMALAKQIQFLKGTQDAFEGMNEVESIHNQFISAAMEETAESFIQPLKKALNKKSPSLKQDASLHQQTLFKSAESLGKAMKDAQPLSFEEINAAETLDLNAIQKMRRILT